MTSANPHIMIVAGEASGDMHAAHLVEAIRRRNPQIIFSGFGGPAMKASGVALYEDLTDKAVVGFVEVLRHYRDFRRIFHAALHKARETRARAVILVDYPGFNLRLAKELKQAGIKVIYYISPQVWAWKEGRVKTIRACTDRMLVLFEFEKEFYARRNLDVDFVGHPLVDMVKVQRPKETFLKDQGLSSDHPTIGILPGSRQKEIATMLPVMLDAARRLQQGHPMIQFLVLKAPTVGHPLIERILAHSPPLDALKVVHQDFYDGLNACDLCMVTSGTATLETALLKKPMVVVYKTSFLTWLMARSFIRIPCIGLVNIVAGKKIVPECIQFQATGKNIADELTAIFADEVRIAEVKSALEGVRQRLGDAGASDRAAQAVLNELG